MPKEGERPYENLTSYKNSLKMAWSDRRMAKEEVDLLGRFRGRFGVSREEHAAIEGLVFLELALEAGSCRDEDGAGHWFDMISTHDPPYEDAHRSYGEYLSRHGRDAGLPMEQTCFLRPGFGADSQDLSELLRLLRPGCDGHLEFELRPVQVDP